MNFWQNMKHNNKMKKIVKTCLISFVLILVFASVFCGTYLTVNYIKFQQIPLNTQALTSPALSIEVYSNQNKLLEDNNQFNGDYCKISDLKQHTKDAFISIEDKDFYKHKGINKKRIIKAVINNLRTMSLKEGASTISQQLIKNTHLSNEKTFSRKLKEIALTKKLEKKFSKDEILECYLNVIYFGNNCYGIESAANYYFNKPAQDLNLNESCTLAGLIKSPNKYSPILHYNNALSRRNLVLAEMEKDGKISIDEKIKTQNSPILLDVTNPDLNKLNSYSQASIDEASKILNLPAKQIAIGGYKIHTYCDEIKQKSLKNSLNNFDLPDVSMAGIVINNDTHGVSAYYGKSNLKLMDISRQPASCLKPLLVYAPALNENIISPETQILDEPLKIGDYQPTNVNKKYSGYVSVVEAVKNSINIPAIKVLSYIGIETGKQYAEKMGINFDENDNSYALALGGMTKGTNLKNLTSAYTVFANKGNYSNSTFIQYITDKNNKLVYIHKPIEDLVLREDSAYLMTNILQQTAKSGTARRLSDIKHTEIASKTGTVGKKNTKGNIDAYDIAFTPEEIVGVWFGSLDNTPQQIAGGNQPAEVVKNYVNTQTYTKTSFEIPSSITELSIDTLEKENSHRIVLASPSTPARYTEKCLFSRFNSPTEISNNFTDKPEIIATCKVDDEVATLTITAQKHLTYQIFNNNIPLQTLTDKQGEIKINIKLLDEESEIKITAFYAGQNNKLLQSEKTFSLSKRLTSKPKTSKWYI